MNAITKKEWTIQGLRTALDNDLRLCTTNIEKSLCKTIGEGEIIQRGIELSNNGRLTPLGLAICQDISPLFNTQWAKSAR